MATAFTRTCPICGTEFTPRSIIGVACSSPCTKRTKKLRETIKAYNAGKKNVTPQTLELIMKLLEADDVIAAQKAAVGHRPRSTTSCLDDECEDAQRDDEERNAYAAQLALERQWMSDWRDAKLRTIARGHRPAWVTSKLIEEAHLLYPDGLPSLAA